MAVPTGDDFLRLLKLPVTPMICVTMIGATRGDF
jgi:hypothetical protein